MKPASILTIVGAVLPILFALALLVPPPGDKSTWAYPTAPSLFTAGSVLLAVSHVLVLVGYVAVARVTKGAARVFLWIGAVGTLAIAAAEVWSAAIPTAPLDGDAVSNLTTLYTVSSLLIIVGSIGASIALLRQWRGDGLALLVSGAYLLVIATPAMIIGDNTVSTVALTVWSLLYVWLGLALRRRPA